MKSLSLWMKSIIREIWFSIITNMVSNWFLLWLRCKFSQKRVFKSLYIIIGDSNHWTFSSSLILLFVRFYSTPSPAGLRIQKLFYSITCFPNWVQVDCISIIRWNLFNRMLNLVLRHVSFSQLFHEIWNTCRNWTRWTQSLTSSLLQNTNTKLLLAFNSVRGTFFLLNIQTENVGHGSSCL